MALKDIKDRIQAQMATVADIGHVYTRAVNARDAEDETAKLVKGGRLHTWFIFREAMSQQDAVINESLQTKATQLVIHGYYAVKDDDGSEGAFDALVDAVAAKLNSDRKPATAGGTLLGGTVADCNPPFLRLADHREYGPSKTLCHHCELVLAVTEDVT